MQEWLKKMILRGGTFSILFLVVWLAGNAIAPSIIPAFSLIPFVAAIVASAFAALLPFYAASGHALDADSKERTPGGRMKGETNIFLIIGVVALVMVGIYFGATMFGTKQSVTGTSGEPTTGGTPIQVFTGPTYTIANTSYDADKPGTAISASAVKAFLDPAAGTQVSLSGVPIAAGTKLTLLGTASNYFGNVQTITTPDAQVNFYNKAVDTTLSLTAYDDDDRSKITGTENLTIGAGGSAIAYVKVRQSANYKHPTGDSKMLCVFVNATSGQEGLYDPSSMTASFDGASCVKYGDASGILANTVKPASSAMGGAIVDAYVCTGADFAAKDSAQHLLNVKYAAIGTTNPGAQNTTGVSVVGADYYTDTTGKLSLKPACVTDTGAAIQAIQSIAIPVD